MVGFSLGPCIKINERVERASRAARAVISGLWCVRGARATAFVGAVVDDDAWGATLGGESQGRSCSPSPAIGGGDIDPSGPTRQLARRTGDQAGALPVTQPQGFAVCDDLESRDHFRSL
ncbi:hypothetical protein MTO96_002750 [Rhipicephalus appendiculatus]